MDKSWELDCETKSLLVQSIVSLCWGQSWIAKTVGLNFMKNHTYWRSLIRYDFLSPCLWMEGKVSEPLSWMKCVCAMLSASFMACTLILFIVPIKLPIRQRFLWLWSQESSKVYICYRLTPYCGLLGFREIFKKVMSIKKIFLSFEDVPWKEVMTPHLLPFSLLFFSAMRWMLWFHLTFSTTFTQPTQNKSKSHEST